MTSAILIVAGGVGAVMRLLATRHLQRPGGFPFGTALANLLGALAIGWVAARQDADSVAFAWQAGFLGGFTTFSTWMVETIALLPHRATAAAINVVGATVAGVALAGVGMWLGG